jgi:hypothetical protein
MVKITEIILAIIGWPIAFIVLLLIGATIAVAVNEIDSVNYSGPNEQRTLDDFN